MLCLNTGPKLAKVSVPGSQSWWDKHFFLFGEQSTVSEVTLLFLNKSNKPGFIKIEVQKEDLKILLEITGNMEKKMITTGNAAQPVHVYYSSTDSGTSCFFFFLEKQNLPQDLQDFKGQSDEKERNFVPNIIIHRGYLNQNTS